MRRHPRVREFLLGWAVLVVAFPAGAMDAVVPKISLPAGLGSAAPGALLGAGVFGPSAAFAPASAASLISPPAGIFSAPAAAAPANVPASAAPSGAPSGPEEGAPAASQTPADRSGKSAAPSRGARAATKPSQSGAAKSAADVAKGAADFDGSRARSGAASAPEAPSAAGAKAKTAGLAYRRKEIADARFGEAERQNLIKQARTLKDLVDRKIIGQERATKILQDRLVQYFEGFGTRTKDPVAAHLIGLPGIGKTAILDAVAQLGFKVERIDVQKYVKTGGNSANAYAYDLAAIAESNKGKPYILLIDELDKLPEIVNGQEETVPFIGALNQILTDGFITHGSGRVDFSNAMVVTTMNFSPKEIEGFSADAVKTPKKYYDFTIEDFAAFDAWIQKDSSARYKLLTDLFRANTVSRLAPNTVIMKPLSAADYAKIVRLTVDGTIASATQGDKAKKRVTVAYTPAYLDFLYQRTVFAPSGARETIAKANALTEQLITFGVKAAGDGDDSLDRPRRISLDFNPASGSAEVTVTPQTLYRGRLRDRPAFTLAVAYDASARLFNQPAGIAVTPPPAPASEVRAKPLTKKEVFAARFPKTRKLTAGLADKIDATLIGQEEHSRLVEKEFNAYLNRPGPAANQPPFLVFAGFPGIGKSELANLTAKHLGLPLVRMNMQAFSSDSQQTVSEFAQSLAAAIDKARKDSKNGKFIVLFEELDKVFEISPEGKLVNRPIMALIKDLLQDGIVSIPSDKAYNTGDYVIDVRDAYNIITMNFAGDRFGFEADPRLTSIEDTRRAARSLSMSPAALKKALGSMFLPETVSRLMSRFHVMSPLDEAGYKKLIRLQADRVVAGRLADRKTGVNKSLLTVETTPAYRAYLFGESVIPSEGARNTVLASQNRLSAHLEEALARIPKSSSLATEPATLVLDFKPGKSLVVASLKPSAGSNSKAQTLYEKEVALTFPPLAVSGRMPVARIKTAAHEFGHAYSAVRLGLRIEYATVVPPKPGVGGYVKYASGPQSARSQIAMLYSDLGSRAMERIAMSRDPLSAASVLDITPGPSNDIMSATKLLWSVLYETGFDPQGGTIERMGVEGMSRYAAFSDVPPETVDKLGRVLRRMEDALVADLLKAHDQAWYQDKIGRFASAGGLTEAQFYGVIGYPYPGRNGVFLGERSRIAEIYADKAEKPDPEAAKAAAFKQGLTGTTALENMDAMIAEFSAIVKSELHPEPPKQ